MSIRLAILGCGAITETCHLPALRRMGLEPAVLIDANLERARGLAAGFPGAGAKKNYRDCVEEYDAALVALPHHLHAPVSVDLLSRGIHVLVEKPMALTHEECERMIHAADSSGAVLAVGQNRRFLHVARWVKAALQDGVLGALHSFDFRDGHETEWAPASAFAYRKETAGGGMLINGGIHSVDLFLWWLGAMDAFDYFDDHFGGLEAECEIRGRLPSGAEGVVELSATRRLRNTAIIRGEWGEIEASVHGAFLEARPRKLLGDVYAGMKGSRLPEQRMAETFERQIDDWLHAIETRASPFVSGREAARAIAFIEDCYRHRQPLELPWVRPERFLEDSGAVGVRNGC